MKSLQTWLCVMVAGVGLTALGAASAFGAEENQELEARLTRVEHQLQQMAGHQEQFAGRGGPEQSRPFAPSRGPETPNDVRVQWHGPRAAQAFWGLVGFWKFVLLVVFVINVLLAGWVYSDIRKRGEGNGVFIVLALLAGIPGTILYALVRIGDRKI